MKIIVDLGHPAHVHLFKNFIWEMEKRGHEVLITARDKEILLDLLNAYGFEYIVLSKQGKNLFGLAVELLKRDYKLFKLARSYKPDILVGISEIIAHVGKLLKMPSITLTDSEPAVLSNAITFPFADVILTPSCFRKDLGKKQVRYNGYHELAYLHPNYFTPNPAVLDELELSKDDTFIILRFVAWMAAHDVGRGGFNLKSKRKLVRELKKYATVFISSESLLPKEFEKYRLPVSPEKIHDALYFADLLIADSQTMTTEAGILGTSAIRGNTFVGENDMGNFIELEQKYGLIFNYNDPNKAIEKAVELIQMPSLKEEWQKKREKLLKDKTDVTAFMVWFIEDYPDSFKEMKENPEIQYKFK